MSDLIWLIEAQMRKIEPYFPLSHGVPRVDDRRMISCIIFVIRNAGCAGATLQQSMGHPRRSTIGLSAGAGWACSPRYSQASQPRRASPTS